MRAREGIFMAFQYPVEIPGVSNVYFLKAALNAIRKHRGLDEMDAMDFLTYVREKMKIVKMDEALLNRPVNEGFSGGEKKRNEIFHMAVLDPILAVMDETDSGLDIDALKIVSEGINSLRDEERAFIVITHYQRLLNYIVPDIVHVLVDGRIVAAAARIWLSSSRTRVTPGSRTRSRAALRRSRWREVDMTLSTSTATDPFLAQVDAFQADLDLAEPSRLRELRRQARERYAELGIPTTQLEAWRFTNVAPIARRRFTLVEDFEGVSQESIERYRYPECLQIALVNGRFSPELSELDGLPEGVVVMSLAEALTLHPEDVEEHLGRHARFDEQHFVALNTAFLRDGVYIRVPRGVVVERPINLLMVGKPASEGDEAVAFFPRILIVAEESSQLSLVEQYVSVGEGPYLSVPVTEAVVGPGAVVDHYKLERESLDAYQLATLAVWQDRSSNFSSHSISWGGAIVRNDVHAILDGEGCESTLNGLYMVEHDQLVDNNMRVEHAKPHCDSHELYKGILEGRARAVFTGRIFVHKGAQKTDAKQTNRNLLLSKDALCNSHPQLEIFADDVRCTHGSTVGQLDENAVFYLRSRGIGEEAAKSLLTYAFASDVVSRVKIDSVRRDLEEFLFRRLPKGDIVRQAV